MYGSFGGQSEPNASALETSAVTAEQSVSSQSSYSATPKSSSRMRGKQDDDDKGIDDSSPQVKV